VPRSNPGMRVPMQGESARHYDDVIATMLNCGSILDTAMIYWDIRLSAHLPTIEIRVSDVPATVEETVLLATLVRGLVTTALSFDRPRRARPTHRPRNSAGGVLAGRARRPRRRRSRCPSPTSDPRTGTASAATGPYPGSTGGRR
jgi:hypothetical protein